MQEQASVPGKVSEFNRIHMFEYSYVGMNHICKLTNRNQFGLVSCKSKSTNVFQSPELLVQTAGSMPAMQGVEHPMAAE